MSVRHTPEMREAARLGVAIQDAQRRSRAAFAYELELLGDGKAKVITQGEACLDEVLDALTSGQQAVALSRQFVDYLDDVGVGCVRDVIRAAYPDSVAASADDDTLAKTAKTVLMDCENNVVVLSSLVDRLREGGVESDE